jgi:4-amino-4-deoxy-L-arabinose transferase-like glycosyltransferase
MQLSTLPQKVDWRERVKAPISLADWVVLAVILLIGAIQFVYYPHTADFTSDPGYPDLARSILDHGTYQFDYLPETTLPPGFPLVLAAAGWLFGLTPAVLFHMSALFTALALMAAYVLLRQIEGRGVAATACLLFGSSPALFGFNTAVIFPEMPYFFISMLVLLLALKIDRPNTGRAPIAWILVLGVALVLAVLIRSVGIALIVGLGTWIVASLLVVPKAGRSRLRNFLLPLLLGAAAQAGWSMWAQRHQVLEWQLPGYPESYVTQLKVKNGQYPELGLARLSELPARVERNIVMRTAVLGEMLTRRHVSAFYSSPAIIGVLILISVGLASSFRNGGQLYDWYFLWEEVIFVFWPWDAKPRFLFPIVPLAVLYLWRGVKVLRSYSIQQPKRTGACIILAGVVLSIVSAAFALRVLPFDIDPNHTRWDHLQPIAATAFWALFAAVGFGLLRFYPVRTSDGDATRFANLLRIARSWTGVPLRIAAILILTLLVGSGLSQELAWGRSYLKPDITQQSAYPEIEASQWIQTHEPSDRVVMARDQDTVFHYTQRRVVWFPPVSNPNVLMDGIRRHHVGVLVVAHHSSSYWLPTEEACFQSLAQSYGSAFHMVDEGRDFRVFEISPR